MEETTPSGWNVGFLVQVLDVNEAIDTLRDFGMVSSQIAW
jgi:hypothetical protein